MRDNPVVSDSTLDNSDQDEEEKTLDPDHLEDRFRIDRRKLEHMIQNCDADDETAEDFFHNIMEDTNTKITWPSKLKIGAKSKKDPHIKVSGHKDAVSRAKEKIMAVLDTKGSRVTLKMDVSHTEHSHVIGKGGSNIKKVMQETGCHIHFPDSNRNMQAEKSNQVSIAGQPMGVENARVKIRELLPLVFMFELPVAGLLPLPDVSSPQIQQIQDSYGVTVKFKQHSHVFVTTVVVRGSVYNAKSVKEATIMLIGHLTGNMATSIPVSMQLEIAQQHHLFIIGRNGANIKQIMQHTGASIHFPDPSTSQPQKKGTVYITGAIENVFNARQQLIGCLPLVLMFDMKEDTEIEQTRISQLMEQLDVYISIKPKPKQPTKSVIVKSIERNAANLHEARRQLLGLMEEPPMLLPPRTQAVCSTRPISGIVYRPMLVLASATGCRPLQAGAYSMYPQNPQLSVVTQNGLKMDTIHSPTLVKQAGHLRAAEETSVVTSKQFVGQLSSEAAGPASPKTDKSHPLPRTTDQGTPAVMSPKLFSRFMPPGNTAGAASVSAHPARYRTDSALPPSPKLFATGRHMTGEGKDLGSPFKPPNRSAPSERTVPSSPKPSEKFRLPENNMLPAPTKTPEELSWPTDSRHHMSQERMRSTEVPAHGSPIHMGGLKLSEATSLLSSVPWADSANLQQHRESQASTSKPEETISQPQTRNMDDTSSYSSDMSNSNFLTQLFQAQAESLASEDTSSSSLFSNGNHGNTPPDGRGFSFMSPPQGHTNTLNGTPTKRVKTPPGFSGPPQLGYKENSSLHQLMSHFETTQSLLENTSNFNHQRSNVSKFMSPLGLSSSGSALDFHRESMIRRGRDSPIGCLSSSFTAGMGSPLGGGGSPLGTPTSPLCRSHTRLYQNGDARSSESGCDSDSSDSRAGSNHPNQMSPSNLFSPTNIFADCDYEQKKLLATKAMQKKPEGESRIPTDFWSGFGFSKSMPDSAIRERLKANNVRYNGPTMTTTYEAINDEPESDCNDPWGDTTRTITEEEEPVSVHTLPSGMSLAPGDYKNSMNINPSKTVGDYSVLSNSNHMESAMVTRPNDWPPKTDLAELFSKLGLGKYTDLFTQQEIDLATFLTMSDPDLKELGISTFGARRKMLLAIADLNKRQTLLTTSPGRTNSNPFRDNGTTLMNSRCHDIASQSGCW